MSAPPPVLPHRPPCAASAAGARVDRGRGWGHVARRPHVRGRPDGYGGTRTGREGGASKVPWSWDTGRHGPGGRRRPSLNPSRPAAPSIPGPRRAGTGPKGPEPRTVVPAHGVRRPCVRCSSRRGVPYGPPVTAYSPESVPGRHGPSATTEAAPHEVGPVRTEYAPVHDGDPDPGEIVWTWVPYEE